MEWNPSQISAVKKEKESSYFLVEAKIPYAVAESQMITVVEPMVAENEKSAEDKMFLLMRSRFSSSKEEIKQELIKATMVNKSKYTEAIARAEKSREADSY
ncbi:MAG: hypothetical protein WC238_01725 [Parcubacteria group bacterium]|jgi:hypothetical protein